MTNKNLCNFLLLVFFSCFIILFSNSIYGQTGSADFKENIEIITDRDLYLSGENIWFRAYYSITGKEVKKHLSNVLYLELIREKQSKSKKKIKLTSKGAVGQFHIPHTIESGTYFLRAYTNYQRNFSTDKFFKTAITIINPHIDLQASLSSEKKQSENNQLFPHPADVRNLIISTDKAVYSTRSKVNFDIKSEVQGCDLTVSVIKKGCRINSEPIRKKLNNIHFLKDSAFTADIRDVSISGRIKDRQTNNYIPNARVYLSVIGDKSKQLHIYQTRDAGEFIFSLNHLTGNRDVFVSVEPTEKSNAEILINNDFSVDFSDSENYSFQIDSSSRKLLESMLLNEQIERNFHKKTIASNQIPISIPFVLNEPGISIRLEDFIQLPSMAEVFTEIVPSARARKRNGKWVLQVWREEQTEYDNKPLVLVDNLPVFNIDEIMKINPILVEKIEVINEPYLLGERTITSAIMITTKTNDFAGIKFPESSVFLEYNTIEPSLKFSSPDYSRIGQLNNRKPDFRNTLYWNPLTDTDKSPENLFFFTSDESGKFEIIVHGIDKNGNELFGRKEFTVEAGK